MEPGVRILLTVASMVILIAGLRAAASLVIPFLLSLFLALLTLPLVAWLQGRRVPTFAAVLIAVLVNVLAVAAILALVAGSFQAFTAAAPRYQARLGEMASATLVWLGERGIDSSQWIPADLVNPGVVLDLVVAMLGGVASVLSNAVLVFLAMVLILLEAAGLPTKLQVALGARSVSLQHFDRVKLEVQRYLGIKTLVSLATGAAVGVCLAALGVDFPVLWGVLAFILNYIPNLGSILAAVPPVLLSIVQLGPGTAVVVAIVYLVVNTLLAAVLEPYLLGRSFGLSTLVVFLSLIFWGWVWGPVGMLLSVPLTMTVKITLENTAELRWIAVLLGPSPKPPA